MTPETKHKKVEIHELLALYEAFRREEIPRSTLVWQRLRGQKDPVKEMCASVEKIVRCSFKNPEYHERVRGHLIGCWGNVDEKGKHVREIHITTKLADSFKEAHLSGADAETRMRVNRIFARAVDRCQDHHLEAAQSYHFKAMWLSLKH
jgi:hypothetical protein